MKSKAGQDSAGTVELQAVLLADSYEIKFRPISNDIPKVLMPLANIPMIDYAIKFLRMNNVKDIIIFASANKKKIEEYFTFKKKEKELIFQDCKITVKASEHCKSVCDALREIRESGLINDDFILIRGDILACFNLAPAIIGHLKRKEQSKSNMVTNIFKVAGPKNPIRTIDDDCAVVLDTETNQILQYDHIADKKKFSLNLEKISLDPKKNINTEIRYDLIDTQISICTSDVLQVCFEHFEFNHFRDDFMDNLLNSEISEDHAFAHILKESEYAQRVFDYRTYFLIGQDFLSRWLYPLTAMTQDLRIKDRTTYTYSDFNVYRGSKSDVAYDVKVNDTVIIGHDTIISSQTTIAKSSIGRNCKIGKNVTIEEAVIWDNVTVEDDAVIKKAILCDHVLVESQAIIKPGCVLEAKVIVRANATVPEKTLVVYSENAEKENPLFKKGKVFEDDTFKLADDEYIGSRPSFLKTVLEYQDSEEEDDDDDEEDKSDDNDKNYDLEVIETIKHNHSLSAEEIAMQVQGVRVSYEASVSETIEASVPHILKLIDLKGTSQQKITAIRENLTKWKDYFKYFVKDKHSQDTLVRCIAEFCSEEEGFSDCFHLIMQIIYQNNIVGGPAILDWADSEEGSTDPIVKKFLKNSKQFIEYIKDQDEYEEDDDDDS